MTGISEILVLVLLIVCILILPRLFKGEPVKKISSIKKFKAPNAKIRLIVILFIAYPVAMALYMEPWNKNLTGFISCGIIPVFLIWGIIWIFAGRKK